ncbi:MAG: alginate export family protein [Phycisphaerae bacterium]
MRRRPRSRRRDTGPLRRGPTHHTARWLLPCVVVSAAAAQPATRAHDPHAFVNQQRSVQERIAAQRARELGAAGSALFDYGGWYSQHGFLFDDGIESSRTLRRHDLRLWGRLTVDRGAHEFYARGRLSLLDFNAGDAFDGNDDDIEGPNLERGYYRVDLRRALADRNRALPDDINIIAKVGRDLARFGTGLALATPLDHVLVRATIRDVEVTGLFGRTVGSSRDIDLSRTATRMRRRFAGAEVRYRGFERHEPFAYALWQRDHNSERRATLFQRFDYDSMYIGLGSSGELRKDLRYQAELVYEGGKGFGNRQFLRRSKVRAWAADVELEYLFRGPHKGRVSVEYLFGSGDGGRRISPTDSRGGNSRGFTDTSFVGFGYRDTGLSFAPRFSNLHMWRAGASLFPMPDDTRFARLEVGTDWYVYYKHHHTGAVSDPTVDVASGQLGWEMDYYVNWEVTADLAWTTRFGVFFPGRALADRTTRTFLLVGVTWSF